MKTIILCVFACIQVLSMHGQQLSLKTALELCGKPIEDVSSIMKQQGFSFDGSSYDKYGYWTKSCKIRMKESGEYEITNGTTNKSSIVSVSVGEYEPAVKIEFYDDKVCVDYEKQLEQLGFSLVASYDGEDGAKVFFYNNADNEIEITKCEKNRRLIEIYNSTHGGVVMDDSSDEPFGMMSKVDRMAMFPGGMKALLDFIGRNTRYPEEAKQEGLSGRVIVEISIDEKGATDSKIIRSSGKQYFDDEAVRLVKLMPRWKPRIQGGKAVSSTMTLPISFNNK